MDNTELLNRSCSTFGSFTRDYQLTLGSATHPITATWQELELLRHFLNADKQGFLSADSITGYIKCERCFVDTKEALENAFPKLTIECNNFMVSFLTNKKFNEALLTKYSDYMTNENAIADGLIIRNVDDKLVDTDGNEVTDAAYSFDKEALRTLSISGLQVSKDVYDAENGKFWDLSFFKGTLADPITGVSNTTYQAGTILGSKWFTKGFGTENRVRCVCPSAITGTASLDFLVCKYIDFGANFTTFSYGYIGSTGKNVKCLILRSRSVVNITTSTLTFTYLFVPADLIDTYRETYTNITFYPIGGPTWQNYFTKATAFDGKDEYWNDYGADPKVQQLIAAKVPLPDQYDLLTTEQINALQQTINAIGKLGPASPLAGLCRRERLWYLELFPELYTNFSVPTEESDT